MFVKAGETKKVVFTIQPKQLAELNNDNSFELTAGNIILSVGGMQASDERVKSNKVIVKKHENVRENNCFSI